MPKLPVLTAQKVISVLEKQGFQYQRQKGSHRIFAHPSTGQVVVVPVDKGKDIPPATLRSILKQANLEVEEFLDLL